jgi:hypothetical protein
MEYLHFFPKQRVSGFFLKKRRLTVIKVLIDRDSIHLLLQEYSFNTYRNS